MEEFLRYWPIIAYVTGLFIGGVGLIVGGLMWIMGALKIQDSERIAVKEAILVEVRDRHHAAMGRAEQLHQVQSDKMDELVKETQTIDNRVVRIETLLNGQLLHHRPEHS